MAMSYRQSSCPDCQAMLAKMYSSADFSEIQNKNPSENKRSFLLQPKSYISKLPGLHSVYNQPHKAIETQTLKTQPMQIPQTSPTQNSAPVNIKATEFFIGDRVIISGVKTGTLLYYGQTYIASGLWCGIALDEPEGKHDGLVNDVRYFTCRQGHGIFAPADKVALLDQKALPTKINAQRKVSQIPSQPKLCYDNLAHRELSYLDRSEELNDVSNQVMVEQIPGLDEDGIIHDSDDEDKKMYTLQSVKPKRKLPKLPKPGSHGASRLEYKKYENELNVEEATSKLKMNSEVQNASIDRNRTYSREEKYECSNWPHSAGGSSGGDDSWSLSKDYLSMCDGKAQYLNITFDGESESKLLTQETSEESPSPEFIFDQEMIEDGEFAAQPIEMSRDSSMGLISSFVLAQNDLLCEPSGDEEGDFDNVTSQSTLEPAYDDNDITPENENLDMSLDFDDADITVLTPFRKLINNVSINCANQNEICSVDEDIELSLNKCQNSSSKEFQNQSRNVCKTSSIQHNLNSTFSVEDTKVQSFNKQTFNKNPNSIFEVANAMKDIISNTKVDLQSQGMLGDSGISMKGSMTESEISSQSSLQNSMIESGVFMKSSTNDLALKQRVPDTPVIVQSIHIDGASVKQQVERGIGTKLMEYEQRSQNEIGGNKLCYQDNRMVQGSTDNDKLISDLKCGHERKERPISILSTTSADTGYVPDTDSEPGTLTLNSPQEWLDKAFHIKVQQEFKQTLATDCKGEVTVTSLPVESDSDFGTMTGETDNEADRMEIVQVLAFQGHVENGLESTDKVTQEDDNKNLNQTLMIKEKTNGFTKEKDDEIKEYHESTVTETNTDKTTEKDSKCGSSDSVAIVTVVIEDKQVVNQNKNNEKKNEKPKKKIFNAVKDFKKPNTTNVVSKLSEYINTPVPVKQREDKNNTEEAKNKRNSLKCKIDLSKVTSKIAMKNAAIEDIKKIGADTEKKEPALIENEPQKKINRSPPKSKWDAIMSKIEGSKDTEKLKPKTEVKSKLEAILHISSLPAPKKEEIKLKKKISSVIPDYSKVQSKLKYTAPPPVTKSKKDESHSRRPSTSSPSFSKYGSQHLSVTDLSSLKTDASKPSSPSRSGTESPNRKSKDVKLAREKDTLLGAGSRLSKGHMNTDRVRNLPGDSKKRSKNKPVHASLAGSLDGKGCSLPGTRSVMSSRCSSRADLTSTNIDGINSGHIRMPKLDRAASLPERRDSIKSLDNISLASQVVTSKEMVLREQRAAANLEIRAHALMSHPNYQNCNKTKSKKNSSKDTSKPTETVSISEIHISEVHRLAALCEARTKQLNMVKLQLQTSNQAFDGISTVVNYIANHLNGFSCPRLQQECAAYKEQIVIDKAQLKLLEEQKTSLENIITNLKEQHQENIKSLESENERLLQYQRESLENKREELILQLKEQKFKDISELRTVHESHIANLQHDCAVTVQTLCSQHTEEVCELQKKQENQMEVLHKQHQDKLEDITGHFDSIKLTLSEKVESLRSECDRLRDRARQCEEALQKDSDFKVQCALAPYKNLPQEIESLKSVLEMKNDKINELIVQNKELLKKLEELPMAQEKITSLQQRKENLEAIISMKADHEKVLHERCQSLMRKYDKESRVNQRLSMEYEELMYKLSESFNETEVMSAQEVAFYQKLGMSSGVVEPTDSSNVGRRLRFPSGSDGSPSKSPAYQRTMSSSVDDREEKKLWRRSGNFMQDERRPQVKDNPLVQSWSPGMQSNSPDHSNERSNSTNLSQSWCVDMEVSAKSDALESKIPRSQSSTVEQNNSAESRDKNTDADKVSFSSNYSSSTQRLGKDDSVQLDEEKPNLNSKIGEQSPLSSCIPSSVRETVSFVNSGPEFQATRLISSNLQEIGSSGEHVKKLKIEHTSFSSDQSVSLSNESLSCLVTKLPAQLHDTDSHDSSSPVTQSHMETIV